MKFMVVLLGFSAVLMMAGCHEIDDIDSLLASSVKGIAEDHLNKVSHASAALDAHRVGFSSKPGASGVPKAVDTDTAATSKSPMPPKTTAISGRTKGRHSAPSKTNAPHMMKSALKNEPTKELFTTDIEENGRLVLQDDCELTTRLESLDQIKDWLKPAPLVPVLSVLSIALVVTFVVTLSLLYMRRNEADMVYRSPQLLALGAAACAACSLCTMWAYVGWVEDGNSVTLLKIHDWCYTALIPLFLLSLCLRANRLSKIALLEMHKAELHRLVPVKGGGGEMRVKMTESVVRTTMLDELQAHAAQEQAPSSERRSVFIMVAGVFVFVLYASVWSLVSEKSCTPLYLHTFNCIFVLLAGLGAVRWFCNLNTMNLREAYGIKAEINILVAISLLLGALHVILQTYLRLFATDSTQLAVGMLVMFCNVNTWMGFSCIFSVAWPVVRMNSQDKQHLTISTDEAFTTVMHDKDDRARFFEFVSQLFCTELTLLWTDINTFRLLKPNERGHDEAWVIYNKYLKSNAVLEVPMAAEFFYEISSALKQSQVPPADMYDTVQEMVCLKLARCFKRYQIQNLSDLVEQQCATESKAEYDVALKPSGVQAHNSAMLDDEAHFNALFEDNMI